MVVVAHQEDSTRTDARRPPLLPSLTLFLEARSSSRLGNASAQSSLRPNKYPPHLIRLPDLFQARCASVFFRISSNPRRSAQLAQPSWSSHCHFDPASQSATITSAASSTSFVRLSSTSSTTQSKDYEAAFKALQSSYSLGGEAPSVSFGKTRSKTDKSSGPASRAAKDYTAALGSLFSQFGIGTVSCIRVYYDPHVSLNTFPESLYTSFPSSRRYGSNFGEGGTLNIWLRQDVFQFNVQSRCYALREHGDHDDIHLTLGCGVRVTRLRWRLKDPTKRDGEGAEVQVCPGSPFAERTLWINIAMILWAFNIRKSDQPFEYGAGDEAFIGDITNGPLEFPAVFEARSARHAEVVWREWEECEKDLGVLMPAPQRGGL
ncbi:hypothetical protein FB45DRAFT_874306 [Roridomyces roridus]|uniref:Uncharacterized protein n=1 Tax=Roridomyces roridus TaxID=1738132 RepID=A0AAD7B9H8_9AGAR|nr:hypothetical protein FB45DRAFT_874306 [Roridomyces roridus]